MGERKLLALDRWGTRLCRNLFSAIGHQALLGVSNTGYVTWKLDGLEHAVLLAQQLAKPKSTRWAGTVNIFAAMR